MVYQGSCHCSAVTFEVEASDKVTVSSCNCSICSRAGNLHLIVPKSKFKLIQGEGNLTTYTFDSGEAKHLFCKTCGIKSFYIPRTNPDGVSVNPHCLNPKPKEIIIEKFDGINWEKNAHKLSHLSK